MALGSYILIGQTPVPCEDTLEWLGWFEAADRHVFFAEVGDYEVSTVFLGLDHGWGRSAPLLFETMIFFGPARYLEHAPGESFDEWIDRRRALETAADPELSGYQERYSTWLEAEDGHKRAVALVEQRTGAVAVSAEGEARA